MHALPVIVNATTGLAEIVDHEVNGLHVVLKGKKESATICQKIGIGSGPTVRIAPTENGYGK
mgnify:CR=1 FL=1